MRDKPAAAPDSTAVRVALWRAMHVQVDPPPHVLEDEICLELVVPDLNARGEWMKSIMPMQRSGVAPSSRRQLLRKIVLLGTTLVVARAKPAIAARASAVKTTARQDLKIEEENQLMPEIVHLIKIRAAQDEVYQAVSTAEGIRDWWTRDAALDPTVGGNGEFGFYGHRMVIKVKVAELTPPRHVAWDPVSSTGGGFDGTTISFDLKSEDGVTSVLFAHRGFKAAGEQVASATTRWGFYLLSLKRYLETGKGTPNPEDTELIR